MTNTYFRFVSLADVLGCEQHSQFGGSLMYGKNMVKDEKMVTYQTPQLITLLLVTLPFTKYHCIQLLKYKQEASQS